MEVIELSKPEELTREDDDCKSKASEHDEKQSITSQASQEDDIGESHGNELPQEKKAHQKKGRKTIKSLINWTRKSEKEEDSTKSQDRPTNPFHAEMGDPVEKREKYASFNSVLNRVSSSTTRMWQSLNKTFSKTPGDINVTGPVDAAIQARDGPRTTMTLDRMFSRRAGKTKDDLEELNLEKKSKTLGRRIASTLRAPFKQEESKREK